MVNTQRCDEGRLPALLDLPQALLVEMVVVIVGEKNGIDLRQVVDHNARLIDAPWPGELKRARALGKDRIDEDVELIDLQQKTGMANEGRAQARHAIKS